MKTARYVYVKPKDGIKEFRTLEKIKDNLLQGGPEAYLAHFLIKSRHAPTLIISIDRTIKYARHLTALNTLMYSFQWYSGMSLKTILSRIYVSTRVLLLLMQFRPTHILCWYNDFPLWMTFLVARLNRAIFVPSRHNRLPGERDPIHRKLIGAINKWVLRRSSAVICHGPYLKQELLDIGVNPSQIIEFNWSYQHLLLRKTTCEPIDYLTQDKEIKIVTYVGRIVKSKGVLDLLEACRSRLREDSKVRLVFAGDGPDLEALRMRIAELRLHDKVLMLGRIRHDRLSGLLCKSKILVTPTQTKFPEGRCMATIEGLVMGVPVIAPDFGPFRYLVKHGVNGLLFEPDCVDSLRSNIAKLLDNDQIYSKLVKGAKQSSLKLTNPEVTFPQALESAFNMIL
jgi:glycosyltransferase involved in cell wall biosynthesis